MTDLTVNKEILFGLGVELSRIGAALTDTDTTLFSKQEQTTCLALLPQLFLQRPATK